MASGVWKCESGGVVSPRCQANPTPHHAMHAREAITTSATEATRFESLFARSQIQTWLQRSLEEEDARM